jgi:hypothetical protein
LKFSNKLGSESNRKNITSLTVISNQNKLSLTVSTIDINRKLNNNRKQLLVESKNVYKTLDKINLMFLIEI